MSATGSASVVGVNNRLKFDGTYNYMYDAEGNLTLRWKISDWSITEYAYDHRNRLTSVTTCACSGGPATSSVEYTYDYQNRQIRRAYDDDGTAGTDSTTYTYNVYQGDDLFLEFSDADKLNNPTEPTIVSHSNSNSRIPEFRIRIPGTQYLIWTYG